MIVFKTFFKVLDKCKFVIIFYTILLIFFGGFNLQTSEENNNFKVSKPSILIVNKDKNIGITSDLIKYLRKNSNVKKIKKSNIDDALFYRDVNYIIYIDKGFRNNFLDGKNNEIRVKSTNTYESNLAKVNLERYMKYAYIYQKQGFSEDEIIRNINDTLKVSTKVKVNSKVNTNELSKATLYYNFANYSFLAGAIYVICLILSSFNNPNIKKRTIISSTSYKKINKDLLLSCSVFTIVLWSIYVILSFILIGNVMKSNYGMLYIINSLIFAFNTLTLAFFISTIVSDKNAVNGIVNVVALGSSFLCGAFVPVEWLPDFVLKVAHVLPSYYYIQVNEQIKNITTINNESISVIIPYMIMIIIFSIVFIIVSNIVSKRNRRK